MSDDTLDEKARTIIDGHLDAIMNELEAVGFKPVGVVAGVLHDEKTYVNWCVFEDALDKEVTPVQVARGIAKDIEASSRPE